MTYQPMPPPSAGYGAPAPRGPLGKPRGIGVSILLAIVLFAGLFGTLGVMVLKPRIATVVENSVAARQGFQAGDLVTAIDGARIDSFMDMQRIVQASSDVPLAIDVDRAGTVLHLSATPERKELGYLIDRAADATEALLRNGLEAAQNEFHD